MHMRQLDGQSAWANACCFSPDSRLIVVAAEDHALRVWEASSGRLVHKLSGHTRGVNSCCFSRDGKQVVSGSADKTLRIWSVQSGLLVRTLEVRGEETRFYLVGAR